MFRKPACLPRVSSALEEYVIAGLKNAALGAVPRLEREEAGAVFTGGCVIKDGARCACGK